MPAAYTFYPNRKRGRPHRFVEHFTLQTAAMRWLTQHSALSCRQRGRLLVMLQTGILIAGAGPHAGARHALKKSLDLARTVREGVGPEVVARVLDQLYEGHQEAPGVRAVDDQPLQQDTCDLLLHNLLQEEGAAGPGLYILYHDWVQDG